MFGHLAVAFIQSKPTTAQEPQRRVKKTLRRQQWKELRGHYNISVENQLQK